MHVSSSCGTTRPLSRPDHVIVQPARAASNRRLCREHYRLTLRLPGFAPAEPGQFVHLSPQGSTDPVDSLSTADSTPTDRWRSTLDAPLLRRAFSIAGLSRDSDGVGIDVIYRVVGRSTRWLESLAVGDALSVMGPLGNRFPINQGKQWAWLVCGGVGLPPMLWLAEALRAAGRETIAFCGARSGDLLALTVGSKNPPQADAAVATWTCEEFSRQDAPVVISTDDGTLGFHGHVAEALAAYADANPFEPDHVVVYTCGPEPMMRGVADFCRARRMECHACMERSMACGTGLCQSCVVPVLDEIDDEGWRYQLCCTDGPVFDAARIRWDA